MRFRRSTSIKLALALVVLVGGYLAMNPGLPTQASQLLDHPDRYELISLTPEKPEPPDPDAPPTTSTTTAPALLHGFPILGSTDIRDPAIQHQLNQALSRAAGSVFANGYRCFSPRHAIRVTHGAEVTEILICFECNRVQVWRGNVMITFWITNDAPQPLFNRILTEAGVPLPPPPAP